MNRRKHHHERDADDFHRHVTVPNSEFIRPEVLHRLRRRYQEVVTTWVYLK